MHSNYAKSFLVTTGIALTMWLVGTPEFSFSGVTINGWQAWVVLLVGHVFFTGMYTASSGGLFNIAELKREKAKRPKWIKGEKSLSARMYFYSRTIIPGAIATVGFVVIVGNMLYWFWPQLEPIISKFISLQKNRQINQDSMTLEITDYISIARDIATGLAAIIGAGVAIAGLMTWRHQLKGKTEYELARRFLRAVYRVRDEIHNVRNPAIMGAEFAAAREEAGIKREETAFSPTTPEELAAVYERRWQNLVPAISDLKLEVLEAEVIWEGQVKEIMQPLWLKIGKLRSKLSLYLRSQSDARMDKGLSNEKHEEIDQVIYKTSEDPSEDPFTGEITEAVQRIEDFIRPHLKL